MAYTSTPRTLNAPNWQYNDAEESLSTIFWPIDYYLLVVIRAVSSMPERKLDPFKLATVVLITQRNRLSRTSDLRPAAAQSRPGGSLFVN
jgi:hypothetical protein